MLREVDPQEMRNRHLGERIIVCGTGPSLRHLPDDPGITCIGVNDIWRWKKTPYVMILDRQHGFFNMSGCVTGDQSEKYLAVLASRPEYWIIRHPTWGEWQPKLKGKVVPLHYAHVRQKGEVRPADGTTVVGSSMMTPTMAAGFAFYMGAAEVGILGVDLRDHHAFNKRGKEASDHFARVAQAHKSIGRLVNLSKESSVDSLPLESLEKWLDEGSSPKSLLATSRSQEVSGVRVGSVLGESA